MALPGVASLGEDFINALTLDFIPCKTCRCYFMKLLSNKVALLMLDFFHHMYSDVIGSTGVAGSRV